MRLRWQWFWLGILAVASLLGFFYQSAGYEQHLGLRHAGPSWEHWLGTDLLGRDLFMRLLCGGHVSLCVGIVASAISLSLGTAIGMLSGYVGGRTDRFLIGCVNAFCALPLTLLTLLFLIFLGNSIWVLCLAIALTEWFTLARVVRSSTRDLRNRTFVQSAYALGQSHFRILCRHIFPHLLPILADYALLLMANAVLLEAFLSFLGIGVQPPRSSWGNMIVAGVRTLNEHPWQLIWPSLCLLCTLFALTTLRRDDYSQ
ncbi:MAG: ABC transporter permease [Puniceicoccales bacterium]|jgi:oligopeptide transport system permease protein|nr:ABC transporter permease [Puniceicoccales bacterium]